MGEMSNFSAAVAKVSNKGLGEWWATVLTWRVQQFFDIFVKEGDTARMILGDNSTGHCFILTDLVLIRLFQINHNCVTEFMLQANILLKLVGKLLEIPFSPRCRISQHVIFLSNRRAKSNILGLQGDPSPIPVPSLSRTSWSPHEENPEGDWSAYCTNFILKQNIYSL